MATSASELIENTCFGQNVSRFLAIIRKNRPVESSLKSPDLWLCQPITHLHEANDEPGENSDYNGPDVFPDNMKAWDDFVTAKDIRSQLSPTTLKMLQRAFTENQLEKFTWGDPECGLNVNEQSFERAWAAITHGINLVLQIVAKTGRDEKDAECVIIGDGDIAKWKSPEYARTNINVKRKKVDYASYQALSRDRNKEIGPDAIFNRIGWVVT